MTDMTEHEIDEPQTAAGPLHARHRAGGSSRTRRGVIGRFGITSIVNVLVIAILAGALIFTVLKVRDQDSQNSLRNSAQKAAATYGIYLSSYNYKNLTGPGSAWAEVETHSTARFRKDFETTSTNLSKLLGQYNATATGQVVAVGLESVSSSKAVALLFVDQTVTNTVQKPNSVTQPLRVEINMVHQNGRWLIDALQVPK
jgi:Mce-associated membrane protein